MEIGLKFSASRKEDTALIFAPLCIKTKWNKKEKIIMVGEPRVPTRDVCFHERRVFPRAELVASTFDRGGFLSSWKKKKINLWTRKNPNPIRNGVSTFYCAQSGTRTRTP
jgi:hypothetical protein